MIYARKALATVLAASTCLLFCACGAAGADGESTSGDAEVTGESVAKAVVTTWSDSMHQLVALLEDKPEASSVMSQVQALKEDTIQRLVALGHQRETLSEAERTEANSLEWTGFQGLSDEDWYTTYNEIWSYYAAGDVEFGNILAAFNTLTQYSDFELLRGQLPDEAARLGVE